MHARSFLLVSSLAIAVAACTRSAPQEKPSAASASRLPSPAEMDKLKADPLPAARAASALEFWLHYKLMQATGLEQALGGEDKAVAALKAVGMAFERSALGMRTRTPRMIPATFDGNGMDAGVMGIGYGLIGGAIAGGLGGMSQEQVSQAIQNGPIKFDGKDGSAQVDIAQDGMDTTLEQAIDENGVTGKVKTQIHLDACPDAEGKLVVTIETESQMGAGGKSGHVKAKFKYERWLDDDARLIDMGKDGYDENIEIEMGGTGASGNNLSVSMTRGFSRGDSDYTGSVDQHGHSIFRPDESRHTEQLLEGTISTMRAMAEAMLTGALTSGTPPWETGRCVDLKLRSSPEKRKGARPNTAYTVFAEPRAKKDGMPAGGTVKATLNGAHSLNPQDKVKADAQFDYQNPEEKDQSASIDFVARSKRGVGKATLDFDTKKGGYRIVATGGGACAEPITVCDVSKPFTNTICGGKVTWTHTPTSDKGGNFSFHYAGGKGFADANGTYALNGPEEEMTAIYTMGKVCGHAAGMTACAPPRTFGATKWTKIEDCDE
jgi:hypothetical protein